MTEPLVTFDELATVQRTPLFTLNSVHPLSALRNVVTGTPTHTDSEYILSSGDRVETADIGRYIPGYSSQVGIGIRVVTAPTGSQVFRWGYYDDEDGFMWKMDASGVSVVIRRDSTDTTIAQADWNIDPADGTGPLEVTRSAGPGFNLDTSKVNIYQLEFDFYGGGPCEWKVQDARWDTKLRKRMVRLHRYAPDGETSLRNPNLPITAENTGTGDGVMAVAGRQFAVLGVYKPPRRTFAKDVTVTTVGTSYTPIIGFRRRNDDDAKRTRVLLSGVTALVTADMDVAVVENPNITFGTAVSDALDGGSESAVEFTVNPSGFSIGDGEPLLDVLVDSSGTGGNSNGSDQFVGLSVPIARRRPVILVARALSGTADITAQIRVSEEW